MSAMFNSLPSATMNADSSSVGSQSYTILRIKRRRDEEPLDALVIESRVRRKKSRGGAGVFQYAQTVEDDAWSDEKRQKDIQEKISRLARETVVKGELKATVPPTPEERTPAIVRPPESGTGGRRYTIIDHEMAAPPVKRLPTSPPKIISAKELAAKTATPDFKMYDAIPSTTPVKEAAPDPEMDKFQSMLNDYLKLNDVDTSTRSEETAEEVAKPAVIRPVDPTMKTTSDETDYVWDVFYHRPASLSEWNEVANVGTLSGLPPSLLDPNDSDSDSEEEDDDDEDSNAEEYYKNDYPDEEDSEPESSDEWHEDSDYDDMMHYKGGAENF